MRVHPVALTGVYKNMNRGIVALVFRCEIVGGEARTSSEAREIAWLTPDELPDRMNDAYSVRLLDAFGDSTSPTVRAHAGTTLVG